MGRVPINGVEIEYDTFGNKTGRPLLLIMGLGATLEPPSDVHASADYRRHLAEVSAVRAVLEAAERARG